MMRSITQALAIVCLAVAPGAAAQPNCVLRFKSWEPQRTSISFSKGHADQSPPTLHVAGGVATTLVFDLVAPSLDGSSDGQVDVFLNEDDIESLHRALQLARAKNEALGALNLQYQLENESPEYALAALLAQGRTDHTPFVQASQKAMKDAGARLAVNTFRRRQPKIAEGKTAVVFEVTNQNPKAFWRFDEVRLISATTGESKSFAVRAYPHILGAGQTGRVAVVFDSSEFGTGDHLVLELWRADGIRQAYVELEKSGDDARLASMIDSSGTR